MKAKKKETLGPFGACALATVRQTARVLTQLYDHHLGEAGVEAAQFALLMTIESAAERTQTELGQMIGMNKTTLSRNLKLLRAKGWVTAKAAQDGRERRMALSREGRAKVVEARPAWRQAQEALHARMSKTQWKAMWSAMETLMSAAGRAMEPNNAKSDAG